tara:strand:+ start:25 stop:210 length:186 start_codon:yes stop_codon:yes gene_type:complete
MKELLEFNNHRIEALVNELSKTDNRILELETFIFELCDRDCPEAYKQVIRTELYEYRQNNR